jgi:hypothetical protein
MQHQLEPFRKHGARTFPSSLSTAAAPTCYKMCDIANAVLLLLLL